jgi:acyl carrier protein
MTLEEELEMSIKDEEAEILQTVGAVIDYVIQRKQLAVAKS